jgi:hypothetical protein
VARGPASGVLPPAPIIAVAAANRVTRSGNGRDFAVGWNVRAEFFVLGLRTWEEDPDAGRPEHR